MPHYVGAAPGKLLLFGEHAAVYGHPSIGIALPWTMEVTLDPSKCWEWGKLEVPSDDPRLGQLIDKMKRLFPDIPPVKISVNSRIPVGVGFGSSGALCVALVKAIDKMLDLNLMPSEIHRFAHEFENVFHFKSSGIDTGISTFGGVCGFRGVPAKAVDVRMKNSPILVVGAVPRVRNTGLSVKNIHDRYGNDSSVRDRLTRLGMIAETVQKESLDPKKIGKLATEAQDCLKALGLSVETHDRILQRAVEAGALGGKLSGAGSGGAYYIVLDSYDQSKSVIAAIEALNIPHKVSPVVFN